MSKNVNNDVSKDSPIWAYNIVADSAGKPHQFHVKSNWQPPLQPSVALVRYLERTKFEIASITFEVKKITFQQSKEKPLPRTKRLTSKERTKAPQLS